MARVLLLDGNSLLFRAFFAVPDDMATSAGVVTNAVYGFLSMLANLLRDHRPDAMAVAFDRAEPTFRHKMVDDYKAGRAETPDILFPQFDMVKSVLDAMGVCVVEMAGFEADDIIATLAARAEKRGDDVIIVSGDRDTFQLVHDPHVRVLYNRRGVSDYELYDEAGIESRTGVEPQKYVLYAALRGDPSDNLPGVPGVGEKTAAKLVNAYSDIDGIYSHLAELTPKLKQNLAESEQQVRSNLEMMPLVRDLELDVGKDDGGLGLGRWDIGRLSSLLEDLEFKGLRRRLAEAIGVPELASGPASETERDATAAHPAERADAHLREAGGCASEGDPVGTGNTGNWNALVDLVPHTPASVKECAGVLEALGDEAERIGIQLAWAGEPGRSEVEGVALAGLRGDDMCCGLVWIDRSRLGSKGVVNALARLTSTSGGLVAHRAKEAMRSLAPMGIRMDALGMDISVAAYLLDPARSSYELEELAELYLPGFPGTEAGEGEQALFTSEPSRRTCARQAVIVVLLEPVMRRELSSVGMIELYDEVENPLVAVLAEMEILGIAVKVQRLKDLDRELARESASLQSQIQELAGEEFTVSSPKQLREILYTKLGLAPSKKTKTGYSTDAASLERLRGQHPIVEKLLRYREVEKLHSTYCSSLIAEVDPSDGRIHASFNQTVARTGRLSSDRPNLHNIPVRSEEGRRFREAFVPSAGCSFLVADYNQIELRVIAHLSGDRGLTEAFASHDDVHTATAARIFSVPAKEVTLAQRSKAKMVSYGLSYGMEAFGLASRLGVGVDEAKAILDSFFASFPGVKTFMEKAVADAREHGYSRTELGRRRPIPELASSNRQVRQAGERQAMNACVQGLAADIFKIALVKLARALRDRAMGSRIVLQVHDEVVVEVPRGEEVEAEELTREAMEGAYRLEVPLETEIAWGGSWAAAKG